MSSKEKNTFLHQILNNIFFLFLVCQRVDNSAFSDTVATQKKNNNGEGKVGWVGLVFFFFYHRPIPDTTDHHRTPLIPENMN